MGKTKVKSISSLNILHRYRKDSNKEYEGSFYIPFLVRKFIWDMFLTLGQKGAEDFLGIAYERTFTLAEYEQKLHNAIKADAEGVIEDFEGSPYETEKASLKKAKYTLRWFNTLGRNCTIGEYLQYVIREEHSLAGAVISPFETLVVEENSILRAREGLSPRLQSFYITDIELGVILFYIEFLYHFPVTKFKKLPEYD